MNPIDPTVTPAIQQRLKDEQAKYAARALFAAATMAIIRAVILPWLIAHSPANTFQGADADTLRLIGFGQGVLFALLAAWALQNPLAATITAMLFFVGIAIPDILNNTGVLAQGLLSKFVLLMILGRGLLAGVLHRTM